MHNKNTLLEAETFEGLQGERERVRGERCVGFEFLIKI